MNKCTACGQVIQIPTRPKSGDTLQVWLIGDALSRILGKKASRKVVVAAASEGGVTEVTANRQYSDWQRAFDAEEAHRTFDASTTA